MGTPCMAPPMAPSQDSMYVGRCIVHHGGPSYKSPHKLVGVLGSCGTQARPPPSLSLGGFPLGVPHICATPPRPPEASGCCLVTYLQTKNRKKFVRVPPTTLPLGLYTPHGSMCVDCSHPTIMCVKHGAKHGASGTTAHHSHHTTKGCLQSPSTVRDGTPYHHASQAHHPCGIATYRSQFGYHKTKILQNGYHRSSQLHTSHFDFSFFVLKLLQTCPNGLTKPCHSTYHYPMR